LRLAWGPGHVAAAEQMDVQVIDGLAAVGAGVDDETIATGQVLVLRNLHGGGEEMAEQGGVLRCGVCVRCEMLLGDQQDVRGRLRVKVWKGEHLVVLVEACDGESTGGDVAEEAVHKDRG
jgi:hypothetical protein